MFERFTTHARRVVVLAMEESQRFGHNYIGTEHLLLGLVHEGEGIAARALGSLGVALDGVRQQVEEIVGRGVEQHSGHIPFTPRTKQVLELSLREAQQLGDSHIGTEHILLGIIREGQGVAAQALVKLAVDMNVIRERVVQLREGNEDPTPLSAEETVMDRGSISTSFVPPQFRRLDVCVFCGRDLYEVERAVTNDAGVLLCKECAWLAVQTMERATTPPVPVNPLRLPPRVFGDVPDDDSVDRIVALFESWPVLSGDELLRRVEGGDRLGTVQQTVGERFPPGSLPESAFGVQRIRFTSGDVAAVRFVISLLPDQAVDGSAERVNGQWKISRDTYCAVVRLAGVECPDEPDDLP